MSSVPEVPDGKSANFWRSVRYLAPHKTIIVVSVLCAFVVGGAMTSGLSAMLPIMQVLINEDSIQAWVDRKIVEDRIGVRLADQSDRVQLLKVDQKSSTPGAAQAAGLAKGDRLEAAQTEGAPDATTAADRLLRALADPRASDLTVRVNESREAALALKPVPFYMAWGRGLAGQLPSRKDPITAIAVVFGILTVLALFGNVFRFFQEYLSDKAAMLAVNDIRRRLYDHVLHIPMGFFTSRGTSDVTSRLAQDTAQLQEGFKNLLGPSVQEPIKVVMAMGLGGVHQLEAGAVHHHFRSIHGAVDEEVRQEDAPGQPQEHAEQRQYAGADRSHADGGAGGKGLRSGAV